MPRPRLRLFQASVAQGLTFGTSRKRGRPLDKDTLSKAQKLVRVQPCEDVRFDQIGHWPGKGNKRRRCAVYKSIKTDIHTAKSAMFLFVSMSVETAKKRIMNSRYLHETVHIVLIFFILY